MSSTLVAAYSAETAQFDTANPPPAVSGSRAVIEDSGRLQVSQLVRLASQHHRSEYNRLKYGAKGGPATYIPLSLQTPDQFKRLLEHQARSTAQQLWWPCTKPKTTSVLDSVSSSTSHHLCVPSPHLSRPSFACSLQEELSAAMSSPLVLAKHPPTSSPFAQSSVKTSETHPLNVSAIIPVELLEIISSHLTEAAHQSPVMYELPSYLTLDKVAAHPHRSSSELSPPPTMPPMPAVVRSVTAPPYSPILHGFSKPSKLANLLWPPSSMRRALYTAVGGNFQNSCNTRPKTVSFVGCAAPNSVLPAPTKVGAIEQAVPSIRTSVRVSEKLQESDFAPPHTQSVVRDVRNRPPNILIRPESYSPILTESPSLSPFCDIKTPALLKIHSIKSTSGDSSPSLPNTPTRTTMKLGNLYLSSCPGKKVRLDGPVKGRGGICRDLRQDLRRMKNLGVACIVCCLDDDELGSLGVSWTDYSRTADEIGLDVLRIPISEGMAPADPAVLDAQLTLLIQDYTLRGSLLLVHCRGGVGRAGLFACCWMLKLGLCGWIDTVPRADIAFTAPENLPGPAQMGSSQPESGAVRRDTMQLVERVIAVVRRRRSPKAIETYEQVKFLVDFVEHLCARSTAVVSHEEMVPDWDVQVD
ncbi:phosphatases II [Amylocystis lapponica]|nr:phosphatases II [Amylocystis lapponica]